MKAISSPLLESSITGCTNAIVNVTGGANVTIDELEEAVETIREYAGTEVNIIFGLAINEELKDEIIVTIVATGVSGRGNNDLSQYSRQTTQQTKAYEQPHTPVAQKPQSEFPEFNNFFRSNRSNNL